MCGRLTSVSVRPRMSFPIGRSTSRRRFSSPGRIAASDRQPLCHQGGESTSGRRGSQGSRLRTCGICSPTGFVAICAGAGQDRATPTSGDDRDTERRGFRVTRRRAVPGAGPHGSPLRDPRRRGHRACGRGSTRAVSRARRRPLGGLGGVGRARLRCPPCAGAGDGGAQAHVRHAPRRAGVA